MILHYAVPAWSLPTVPVAGRDVLLYSNADTPGHEQYTRNMVTGASTASAEVVLVDASQLDFGAQPLHGLIICQCKGEGDGDLASACCGRWGFQPAFTEWADPQQ